MIGIISALQVMWALWTIPVAAPLLLVYSPVVLLPAFLFPFVMFFSAQKILGWMVFKLNIRDEGYAKKLVTQDGMNLKNLSEARRAQEIFVVPAVRQNGLALRFASEELRGKKAVVLIAVREDGLSLQYASEALRDDFDVVRMSCKQDGLSLKYASDRLRGSTVGAHMGATRVCVQYSKAFSQSAYLILLAAKDNGHAFQFASQNLRSFPEEYRHLVLAAVKLSNLGIAPGVVLEHASEECKKDPFVVKEACLQHGLALGSASDECKKDKAIVMAAVTNFGSALQFVSHEFQLTHKDVVLAALRQNGHALHWIPDELLLDREVALAAVKQNGRALRYLGDEFREDEEIVLTAVEAGGTSRQNRIEDPLEFASKSLTEDPAFMKKVVEVRKNKRRKRASGQETNTRRAAAVAPGGGGGGGGNGAAAAAAAAEKASSRSHAVNQASSLGPASFSESVFALKASVTQLFSIVIVMMTLLPLYFEGLGWWAEGASQFISLSFDIPKISLDIFYVSFAWPELPLPRMSWQLASGAVFIVMNLFFVVSKEMLWEIEPRVRMRSPTPVEGSDEDLLMRILSGASWRPFRAPMEVTQAAMESVFVRYKSGFYMDAILNLGSAPKPDRDSAHVAFSANSIAGVEDAARASFLQRFVSGVLVALGTVLCILPLDMAIRQPRQKIFSHKDGDDDVLAFCDTEDAMAYRAITCKDNPQITDESLQHIAYRCTWIRYLDFENCEDLNSDIADLDGLDDLLSVRFDKCPLLHGEGNMTPVLVLFVVIVFKCVQMRMLAYFLLNSPHTCRKHCGVQRGH